MNNLDIFMQTHFTIIRIRIKFFCPYFLCSSRYTHYRRANSQPRSHNMAEEAEESGSCAVWWMHIKVYLPQQATVEKTNPITSALKVITLIKSANVARQREASFTGLVQRLFDLVEHCEFRELEQREKVDSIMLCFCFIINLVLVRTALLA